MKSPIWEIVEIQNFDESGAWFYGLVRYEGKVSLAEIFPGLGFASAWPLWDKHEKRSILGLPKVLWWIVKDIIWAARRA